MILGSAYCNRSELYCDIFDLYCDISDLYCDISDLEPYFAAEHDFGKQSTVQSMGKDVDLLTGSCERLGYTRKVRKGKTLKMEITQKEKDKTGKARNEGIGGLQGVRNQVKRGENVRNHQ